jgi:hypothetical protein
MHFAISNVCTSFQPNNVVGTKVVEHEGLLNALSKAVAAHDTTQDRVPGQHFIPLNDGIPYISGGVGKRTQDTSDYVLREWRGEVRAFLKRRCAAKPQSLAVIVYTREAYLADPDLKEDPAERERIEKTAATHVIVAVLSDATPVEPGRFVANLAGANKEALVWTADEIRAKAAESREFWMSHCVVAD